jgi:hypothetical protein
MEHSKCNHNRNPSNVLQLFDGIFRYEHIPFIYLCGINNNDNLQRNTSINLS